MSVPLFLNTTWSSNIYTMGSVATVGDQKYTIVAVKIIFSHNDGVHIVTECLWAVHGIFEAMLEFGPKSGL